MSLPTELSQNQGWQLDTAADMGAIKPPDDHELRSSLSGQNPSGPQARSSSCSATSSKPGAAKSVPQILSKDDRWSPLRFYLMAGTDVIGAQARNVLASLDDPPLEVIDGPPQRALSDNSDGFAGNSRSCG